MPIERVRSQGFKDISLSFSKNALTNDVVVIKDETAIARSVRNLILIKLGEVYFNPTLGTPSMLFENIDGITLNNIRDTIRNTITEFEPRVNLSDIDALLNENSNELNIILIYQIIGLPVPEQRLSFALVPTR